MNDQLRDALTPADDGRAFTDAVLLQASGALHRRRAAAADQVPALDWLASWARPWVVAALVAIAAIVLIPTRQSWTRVPQAASVAADSEALAASLLPADMALAAATESTQER
jgi:hypothetical protein